MDNVLVANMGAQVFAQTAILTITYTYTVNNPFYDNRVGLHVVIERNDLWLQQPGYLYPEMYMSYYIKLSGISSSVATYVGQVSLPLYPLPANTALTIKLYEGFSDNLVTSINISTGYINTQFYYIDLKYGYIGSSGWLPDRLSDAQKEHNVKLMYDVLHEDHWTDEAIAVMAGFCEFYGDLNPMYNYTYLQPYQNMHQYSPNYFSQFYTYSPGLYAASGFYEPNRTQFGFYGSYDNSDIGTAIPANGTTAITKPNIWVELNNLNVSAANRRKRGMCTNCYLMPQMASPYTYIPNMNQGSGIARQKDDSCLPFLPVYRQHFVDIMDINSLTPWYATNSAFTFEQFLEYLKYVKETSTEYLLLIGQNQQLLNFATYTYSQENPYDLAVKLWNSISKYEFIESGEYRTSFGYVTDSNYRRYGSELWGNPGAGIWIPDLAMKWYRFIKSLGKKKKGMPVWEMLRYTI